MYFIGWDMHKKRISGATLDCKGNILNESEFEHSVQGAEEYLKGYPPECTHIVMESSSQIYKLYDYLVEQCYDIKVAHAKEMHRITKSSKKHVLLQPIKYYELHLLYCKSKNFIQTHWLRSVARHPTPTKVLFDTKTENGGHTTTYPYGTLIPNSSL